MILPTDEDVTTQTNLLQVPGEDANSRFYRVREGDRVDLQAFWPFGFKGQLPPKVNAPSVMISIDESDSQIPFSAPPFLLSGPGLPD